MDVHTQLELLLNKSGQKNIYQFIITFLFLLLFSSCEFFRVSLPYIEATPFIIYEHKSQKLTYQLCDTIGVDKLIFDDSKPVSSLVTDYQLYCDETKVSLIGMSIYAGMLFGAFISYLFADFYGRKHTLVSITPLYIILSVTFAFVKDIFKLYYVSLIFLFFIGLFSYILMITLLVYICEIVYFKHIPIFVTIIVSGLPLNGMISNLMFEYFNNTNWKWGIVVNSGIVLIVYLLLVIYIVESPIYYLNNGNVDLFKKNLNKISKKNNGKALDEGEYEFLYSAENESMAISEHEIKEIDNSLLPKQDAEELLIDTSAKKDKSILSISTEASSSIFGKYKMKDYSPLDLLRYKSQISNFLILSFLWGINIIILHGLNIQSKNVYDNNNYYFLIYFVSLIVDLIGYYLILYLILNSYFGFHKTLVSLQLLSLSILMFSLLLNDEKDSLLNTICLYISKFCSSCMYSLLTIITIEIYPTMIRTKGLGVNKGIGKIGGIIAPFLSENLKMEDLIVYYIAFIFFGLLFAFGLPDKIGTLRAYQVPENEIIEDTKKKSNKD